MAAKRSAATKESGIGGKLFWLVTRIGIPLAIAYGIIWWRVDAGVTEVFDHLRTTAQATRGSSFFGLNGDVGVNNVHIGTPVGVEPAISARIDRVTIHTPGLVWLLRSSLFGMEQKLPARLGATFSNFEIAGMPVEAKADAVFGTYSGALFEADGCGQYIWDRGELRGLGLTVRDSELSIGMNRLGADALEFVMRFGTPGAGASELNVMITAPGMDANPTALLAATLTSASFAFRDEGFIAARNAHCAKQTNVAAAAFVDKHVEAVREKLLRLGLVADAPLEAAYRRYATNGGELLVRARPQPGFIIANAAGYSPEQWRYLLSPIVEVPGGDPVLLALKPASEVIQAPGDATTAGTASTPAATAPAAAAPATADTAAATSAPASVATDVVTAPAPPVVQEARPLVTYGGGKDAYAVQPTAYDELRQAVGREIVVRTNNGTTRRGVLVRFSNASLELQLSGRDGGFQLSIPQHDVRDVGIVVDGAESASAQGKSNAKKN